MRESKEGKKEVWRSGVRGGKKGEAGSREAQKYIGRAWPKSKRAPQTSQVEIRKNRWVFILSGERALVTG